MPPPAKRVTRILPTHPRGCAATCQDASAAAAVPQHAEAPVVERSAYSVQPTASLVVVTYLSSGSALTTSVPVDEFAPSVSFRPYVPGTAGRAAPPRPPPTARPSRMSHANRVIPGFAGIEIVRGGLAGPVISSVAVPVAPAPRANVISGVFTTRARSFSRLAGTSTKSSLRCANAVSAVRRLPSTGTPTRSPTRCTACIPSSSPHSFSSTGSPRARANGGRTDHDRRVMGRGVGAPGCGVAFFGDASQLEHIP